MSLSCGMMPLRNATWILEHFTDTEEIQKQTRLHHRSKQETNSCHTTSRPIYEVPIALIRVLVLKFLFSMYWAPPEVRAMLSSWISCQMVPAVTTLASTSFRLRQLIREIRLQITNELVEFEKLPVEVQDFRKMIHHTRGIQRIHPTWVKTNRKM